LNETIDPQSSRNVQYKQLKRSRGIVFFGKINGKKLFKDQVRDKNEIKEKTIKIQCFLFF
jgi:hypothetical protein